MLLRRLCQVDDVVVLLGLARAIFGKVGRGLLDLKLPQMRNCF